MRVCRSVRVPTLYRASISMTSDRAKYHADQAAPLAERNNPHVVSVIAKQKWDAGVEMYFPYWVALCTSTP